MIRTKQKVERSDRTSGDTVTVGGGAANVVGPLIEALVGRAPVRFGFWDGTSWGPTEVDATVHVRSPIALRRLLWSPGELGLGRAFVMGDLDVEGDLFQALRALRPDSSVTRAGVRALPRTAIAAWRLGAVGRRLPPPPEEARPHGRRHSTRRDAAVVGHHYDVGNDFYRLVLGPSMTYSCARFSDPSASLEEAQASKHDLVCRKLGLQERTGMRLLDIGCGWGSMSMHAARHFGASVVGVTISREQLELGRRRVEEAGLSDHVELRLQDYRDVAGERFDAISSIGMSEHVGRARITEYFSVLSSLLVPRGRVLNHAISSEGGLRLGRRTFMGRYVFPDAELLDVGDTVLEMEDAGFEVRHVESLREHYALTLRQWIANLDENWDDAVTLVGTRRARVWRLYMAAAALGFEDGSLAVHQVLGVVTPSDGVSAMPRTSEGWAVNRTTGQNQGVASPASTKR